MSNEGETCGERSEEDTLAYLLCCVKLIGCPILLAVIKHGAVIATMQCNGSGCQFHNVVRYLVFGQ